MYKAPHFCGAFLSQKYFLTVYKRLHFIENSVIIKLRYYMKKYFKKTTFLFVSVALLFVSFFLLQKKTDDAKIINHASADIPSDPYVNPFESGDCGGVDGDSDSDCG